MTAYRQPLDAPSLAHNFRVFAAAECASEPLYAALASAIAERDEVIDLLLQAPYRQRRPVLLFAAIHSLLLSGRAHQLARFYRSVTPDADVCDEVGLAIGPFYDFIAEHRGMLLDLLRERSTQTNEVGRCAVLRAILAGLDPSRPIALIDIGCSAGLNLLVDRYGYLYRWPDGSRHAIESASQVMVSAVLEGDRAAAFPIGATPPVVSRHGIDLAPLDVRAPGDALWLRACLWPSDIERHERLARAIAVAGDIAIDLRRGDADLLGSILDSLDRAARPIVFHSWAVSYFDHAARVRFAAAMRTMVEQRDGVWISGEAAGVVPGLAAPEPADDESPERREATLWHRTARTSNGDAAQVESRLMARSHAHGRWVEWLHA